MNITKIDGAWDFNIIRVYTIDELKELAQEYEEEWCDSEEVVDSQGTLRHEEYWDNVEQFIEWLGERDKLKREKKKDEKDE